mmetsp:Transcript_110423/g.330271  ORF Transcript_110423/g.330271 Transcript_110423/m.330271 type:complete len:202 (-) Transcript_110423:192-797(-)
MGRRKPGRRKPLPMRPNLLASTDVSFSKSSVAADSAPWMTMLTVFVLVKGMGSVQPDPQDSSVHWDEPASETESSSPPPWGCGTSPSPAASVWDSSPKPIWTWPPSCTLQPMTTKKQSEQPREQLKSWPWGSTQNPPVMGAGTPISSPGFTVYCSKQLAMTTPLLALFAMCSTEASSSAGLNSASFPSAASSSALSFSVLR